MAIPAATTHLVPSAEHAIEDQRAPGTELDVHVLPRSDEAYNAPVLETANVREPFAGQPMAVHPKVCGGSVVAALQLSPLLVETMRPPEVGRLNRICPSAEQATRSPIVFANLQVSPELVDTYVELQAAMRTEPSADEATEVQLLEGEVVAFQVAPPSGEMYTGLPKAIAASLLPSAEDAAPIQLKVGALFEVHVCAWRLMAIWIRRSQSPASTIPRFLR